MPLRVCRKGEVSYAERTQKSRANGQPKDCATRQDWARKIAVAFLQDCEDGMHRYGGHVSTACNDRDDARMYYL